MYVCFIMEKNQLSKESVAASTIPIILTILKRQESYGYEIIKQVKAVSGEKLNWKEGSMYPVLAKLEQKGLIQSRWIVGENGRKRKYYSLNEKGKKQLANDMEQWQFITQIFSQLWKKENIILKG